MVPDKPLRFCMVTTFYPPYHFGGDGVFVYRLTQALAERGHSVDVIHSVDAYRLQHPAEPEVAFHSLLTNSDAPPLTAGSCAAYWTRATMTSSTITTSHSWAARACFGLAAR